jgi:hypothetical protein
VLRQELVTDDRARACDQVRQAPAAYRNIAALRGNPTGRDFPVLELTPGGGLKLLGVYPLPAPAAGQ